MKTGVGSYVVMRARPRVRWDPLALLAALFAMVITVGMWFDLWGIRNATSVRHFFVYLALVGAFFVLFLIAAASLPDEPSDGVDLREFCRSNRRYFWSLVTLFEIIYVAFGIHFLASVIDRLPHGRDRDHSVPVGHSRGRARHSHADAIAGNSLCGGGAPFCDSVLALRSPGHYLIPRTVPESRYPGRSICVVRIMYIMLNSAY